MPDSAPPFTFVPGDDAPVRDEEALSLLEQAITGDVSEADLVVGRPQPGPLGKSWAFDFARRSFLVGIGGPLATRDHSTLGVWVEKCLNTARGAHPACPPWFGLAPGDDVIGHPVGYPPPDLTERIHDALTQHPRITDVVDVTYEFQDDEDWLACSLVLVTDEDDRVPVAGLVVTA